MVCAYFGIAFHLVKGKTLHSVLRLPIRGKHFHDLQGPALTNLQETLSCITYIIIDEYSVIGQNLFGWIDKRCRQGTGINDKPFGGIFIILVGDIAQLPPVMDRPLFYNNPLNETAALGYCMYKLFTTVVQLKVNERCKSDTDGFKQLLSHVRNGTCTVEDWKLLLKQSEKKIQNDNECVKLCFTNDKVIENNSNSLKNLNEPVISIHARHNCKLALKCSAEDMGGLEAKVFLSRNAKVMLTKNLWTDKGLCNGAIGYVENIVYKSGDSPPS